MLLIGALLFGFLAIGLWGRRFDPLLRLLLVSCILVMLVFLYSS